MRMLALLVLTVATLNADARKDLGKIAIGQNLTVIFNDGQERYGRLSRAGPDDFDVDEVDLKQTLTIRYDEVKKRS